MRPSERGLITSYDWRIQVLNLLSYAFLRLALQGVAWISPIDLRIATQSKGLLLAAVTVQFTLDAWANRKGKLF